MTTRYIDALDVTIADSFVVPSNKVESGHGEAKLYVGHRTSDNYRDFFGPTGFQLRCRLRKTDLLRFLEEMRTEYFHPSFSYRDSLNFKNLWVERKRLVEELPSEEVEFFVEEQSHLKGPRGYVNSDSSYYELIRLLPLPNTSRLKIVKLEEDSSSIYEFKLMPDFDGYTTRPYESEVEAELEAQLLEAIPKPYVPQQTTVERIVKARVGQQQFKRQVLQECDSTCAFTLIRDPGLLIAGHIKPWAKSDDIEKLDPKNGLVFTPTYDRLFNNGLISFTEQCALIISPLLSRETSTRLHIHPNMELDLPMHGQRNRARQDYMEFHREFILRK
jgi:putative restriction endonuclease